VALGNTATTSVDVYLYDSVNKIFPITPKSLALGQSPSQMAVGQVNKSDAYLDIAVTTPSDGTVKLLLGKGDGTFYGVNSFQAGQQPTSIALGDVNGDGNLDIVVTNNLAIGPGTVSVLLGNGGGGFSAPYTFSSGGAN